MKKQLMIGLCLAVALVLTSCFGGKETTANGGELTGASGKGFSEPAPYGMVLIKRGHLRMGLEAQDTLWGKQTPVRDISVEGFWMDDTEITNSEYRQFVNYVRDSIIRERLADPNYGGDESYKIEEDKDGNPVKPYLNWKKSLPRKPNEDELRAIESVYVTNPVTGEKMLDASQMNYRYEIYDYTAAALRRNRINPAERNLNTDVAVDPEERVMISKDTAFVDDEGRIVRQTINRELTGPWDFLNTYIVNIYPDTTCFQQTIRKCPVFPETRRKPGRKCPDFRRKTDCVFSPVGRYVQRYRLPTEAEWEFAARGKEQNEFPWANEDVASGKGCFYANFKPDNGNYTKDGNLITSKTGIYSANSNGLFDMAGNVAEWTSTIYTEAGVDAMNDINPQLKYNAALEDPYRLKKKSVRGGSWKDPESYIRSAWRSSEYQNQPRSYIGFRCVRSLANTSSEKARPVKASTKKTRK